ncbi:MAG: TIGR02281 family clan AA aspartic protease [Candidatus Omnitrophica bacterium]|nr:TIGR02281 family clan AA aspartic protease [Candidatus Omnitrophota bacterium]
MIRLLKLSLCILLVFSIGRAWADTVYLKNGRGMSGVITKETDDFVELAIGMGKVKFYRHQIERIARSSQTTRKAIEQAWEEERLRNEAELAKQKEEAKNFRKEVKALRIGDHLLVNALINGGIKAKLMLDTGASNVMLSLKKANELGLGIKKDDKPDAKMKLADGTEVGVKMLKLKSIDLDGAQAREVEAAVILSENMFKDFDGLLGMSYLKSFRFEINLDQNRLILQNPEDDEK